VHIFTAPSKFHVTPIGNHDLEIINWKDIEVDFLGNAVMNKIMGSTTVDENDDFPVLNVAN
jgi:hypothetical protein